jgi:hypothetical protein
VAGPLRRDESGAARPQTGLQVGHGGVNAARYSGRMTDDEGLRERVTRQGEEAIGKLAQELLDNPVVSGALSAAFETRERAMRAQEVAMGALNLPSASDLERLTRRLRGVSQRLEGIEDGLDRLEQRIEGLGAVSSIEQRLTAIEEALARVESALGAKA